MESAIRNPQSAIAPPLILFPVHGSEPEMIVDAEKLDIMRRLRRETIRKNWDHPGVQAVVQFIELTAAGMQRDGLHPDAGIHGQGAGWGAGQVALALRQVWLSREQEGQDSRDEG